MDDMLKLKLYEATKGGVRGVGRYCTGVDNILVSVFVCVCVFARAGVKSAKSLWLQPPEFGNFLETDASKNYQRESGREGGVGCRGQLHLPAS